jgi:hypothetical protein
MQEVLASLLWDYQFFIFFSVSNNNLALIFFCMVIKMRVKEMHPLCCISLESSEVRSQSPDATLTRARSLPETFFGGSNGNVGRKEAGSKATVAGVLYKWTNYGKGWRSRWFLLKNGVLSYSKIRRPPESINLGDDVRLIGEISTNRLLRLDSRGGSGRQKLQKTVGLVHLKVISLNRKSEMEI